MKRTTLSAEKATRPIGSTLLLLAMFVGFFSTVAIAAPRDTTSRPVQKLLAKADEALGQADLASAGEFYRRALERTQGTSIDARIGLGRIHLELGEYSLARQFAKELFEDVALDDPRRADVHLLQGEVLLRGYLNSPGDAPVDSSPRLRKAEAELQQVLKLTDRQSAGAWSGLVHVYCQLAQLKDAQIAARHLVSIDRLALYNSVYENLSGDGLPSCGYLGRRSESGDYRTCGRLASDPTKCVLRPNMISKPPPRNTEETRRTGVSGVVTVDVLVDETGRVADVQLLQDPGNGIGQFAVDTIRSWRFEPPMFEEQPVSAIFEFSIDFQLQ